MPTKFTIFSPHGSQYINTDTYDASFASSSTPFFKAVEDAFNKWFESQPRDTQDMYFSEDAIYDKASAIRSGMQNVIDYMVESKSSTIHASNFHLADIQAAFE
jgi:hypothetical protein